MVDPSLLRRLSEAERKVEKLLRHISETEQKLIKARQELRGLGMITGVNRTS